MSTVALTGAAHFFAHALTLTDEEPTMYALTVDTEPTYADEFDAVALLRIAAGMCPDPGCQRAPAMDMHRSIYAPGSGVLPLTVRVCAPHYAEILRAEDAAAVRAEAAATSADYLS